MSKSQPKQTAQKPAERAPKPHASTEAPALEQAPLVAELGRQGQAGRLPEHPTNSALRQASILRLQRRRGNSYVQRILAERALAERALAEQALAADGNSGLQRQPNEEETPSAEQQASAKAAAQAAEAGASQAATQSQQQASNSAAAAGQAQQAGAGAAQQAAAQQATAQQAAQGAHGTPDQSGPAAPPQGPGQQGEQAPGGEQATEQAPAQEGGGPSGAGAAEQAPTSPEEDSGFLAIMEQIRQKAEQQKSHPQAGQKAQEAQQAAESPAAETQSQANTGHVQEIGAAETPPVDQAGIKAQIMQKVQAATPRTAQEAEQFKSSNKLGGLKSELKSKMEEEKGKTTGPMKAKSEQGPNQVGISPKPVTPLPPPQPAPPLQQFDAAPAVPKPKPKSEVEKPLKEKSRALDQQMAEADITEEQLEKSNEPEFMGALEAKKEAQQNAAEAPGQYRQDEREQISQAQEEASGAANDQLQGMQEVRQGTMEQVGQQQGQAKGQDEAKRQEVAEAINAIYERTKANVDAILDGLDARVNPIFEAGAAAAQASFETYVTSQMEAYKQRRYGGLLGWARWAKDKLLGMPAEVNQFYNQGRQLYLSQMDAVIDNVVAIIGSALGQARQAVAQGRQEIRDYVNQLPADLREVGQEAAAEIQTRFDQLEQEIGQRQDALIEDLAERYNAHLQAVDARIESMQAENGGLLQALADRLMGVARTIAGLTQRLTSILSRVGSAVRDIMRDPVGFLGNLLGAVRTGLMSFVGNVATHLRRGLVSWLFDTLGDAGIELPDRFDMQGILAVVMRVLGVTWENIRARAVTLFGERVVGLLENAFDIFQAIRSEGLGGLFRFVRDQVTGIKDTIFEAIRQVVATEIIQAGIRKLIGLLGGPAGAFIQAVEAIYNVVSWFIGNAQQVASLVGSIIGSVQSIVRGAIGQAAGLIERSLARAIPTAISFLANLLGLGGISRKIADIIQRVRTPVDRVIDWVLNKAGVVARGLSRMLGGGEESPEATGQSGAAEAE